MAQETSMHLLSGWGKTAPSQSRIVNFESVDSLRVSLQGLDVRGAISRGLGRSYGAPAQNAGGTVILMSDNGEAQLTLDPVTGIATADARVSLDRIMRELIPAGWFVPVTPGTRQVTVGGAIASDIHGKNHHVDGSFGCHVTRMKLLRSDGGLMELSPGETPKEFWATVGGMGLTGVILEASFRMIPIGTSKMRVETSRARDLDSLMGLMSDDDKFRYSVAWIDLLARGAKMGRGVLTRGDHATVDQLDAGEKGNQLAFDPKSLLNAPPIFPSGLLNKMTVAAFNELWFQKSPRKPHEGIESIGAFFHPLDGVGNWNRLYGPSGFVQYQFVVPFGAEPTLRAIIETLSNERYASFLAVLKYFGDGNPAPLSFPSRGWTLALDIPARGKSIPAVFAKIDEMVLGVGGRHYLAKDAHISPKAVQRGYVQLESWKAIQRQMDPARMWQSDLSRRLQLTN